MDTVLELPYLENKLSKEIVQSNTPRVLRDDALAAIIKNALAAIDNEKDKPHEEYISILTELQQKKELDRNYISSLYTKKPFHEAVFATLIWGGLNTANLNRFLEENIESINTKIQNVKTKLCDEHDIESAFKSMLIGGKNHINGVGIAFFTKILYFLSADIEGIRPLIFDKWTQTIHAVSLPDDGKDWYVLRKTETGSYYAPQFTSKTIRAEAYLDFITKMHNLSKGIGVQAGLIEEYLFGCSKKYIPDEWNDNNPRKKLVDYVINRPSCKVVLPKNDVLESKGKRNTRNKPERTNSAIDLSSFIGLAEDWYHKHDDIGKFDINGVSKNKSDGTIILEVPLQGNHALRLGCKEYYFCGIYDFKIKTDLQEYPELPESRKINGIIVGRYFKDGNKTAESFELFKSLFDRYK